MRVKTRRIARTQLVNVPLRHSRLRRAAEHRRLRAYAQVRRDERQVNRAKIDLLTPFRPAGRRRVIRYTVRRNRLALYRQWLTASRDWAREAVEQEYARRTKARSAQGRVSLVKKFENGIPDSMWLRAHDDRYDIGNTWPTEDQLTTNQRFRYFGLGLNDLEYLAWHFGEGAIHFTSQPAA